MFAKHNVSVFCLYSFLGALFQLQGKKELSFNAGGWGRVTVLLRVGCPAPSIPPSLPHTAAGWLAGWLPLGEMPPLPLSLCVCVYCGRVAVRFPDNLWCFSSDFCL